MEDRIALLDRYIEEVLKKKKVILPEHNLVEDLGLNSIQMMSLIEKIENDFDIIIPIQKLHTVKTVEDLHKMIMNLEAYCE